MYLGGIVDDFIDTEYIWSMDFKKGISNISVDSKSKFIINDRMFFGLFSFKVSSNLPI